jgi:hypothetical protein
MNEVGVLPLGAGQGVDGAGAPMGGAVAQQGKGRKLLGLAGDALLWGSVGASVSGIRKSGHETAANVASATLSTVGTGLFLFSGNAKVAAAGRNMALVAALEVAINVGGDFVADMMSPPHRVTDTTDTTVSYGTQTLSSQQLRSAGGVSQGEQRGVSQEQQETVAVGAGGREAA